MLLDIFISYEDVTLERIIKDFYLLEKWVLYKGVWADKS